MKKIFPGADQHTPSRAEYFTWINNTNEGANDRQTRINFAFFQYLHDQFGMLLDIYAFDAGAVDGKFFYGKCGSERFHRQFPEGFGPLAEEAAKFGARLGLWCGPNGFGETPAEEEERTEQMVSLCRDHHFTLFKFDTVCGILPPEKEKLFIRMMTLCREAAPDLITLNHRIPLSEEALAHMTTFLWDGMESYIDVFSFNSCTAPHHRAGALARGNVPGLSRLAEDHGVCLSSCLDGWDHELILQAFGRALIVAPEIYGNPWLLRDDELPKLARIFNLHRKFRANLTEAMPLNETQYGPHALSRGSGTMRWVTLRNLTWKYAEHSIRIADLGLEGTGPFEARRFHPHEFYFGGNFTKNDTLKVILPPFSSFLLYVGKPCDEPWLPDCDYDVEPTGGTPLLRPLVRPVHTLPPTRKVGSLRPSPLPPQEISDFLYETAVFSVDNNALEFRSLARSGPTAIPQSQAARDAFFNQKILRKRGCCDRFLFDDDPETGFWPSRRPRTGNDMDRCAFRLDLGEEMYVDTIRLQTDDYGLFPLLEEEGVHALCSSDLRHWWSSTFSAQPCMTVEIHAELRYFKLPAAPQKLTSLTAFAHGRKLDLSGAHASNLFPNSKNIYRFWQGSFVPGELLPGSKLCAALEGRHGIEGAWALLESGGNVRGATDRAPSFPSNNWEHVTVRSDHHYTFYFPLDGADPSETLTVMVLGTEEGVEDLPIDLYLYAPE